MTIAESTKTATGLMFFFDFRILITPYLQILHVKLLLQEKQMSHALVRPRHQSKFSKCYKQKQSSLQRVGYLLYGIYLSQMTKDMLCFLSSQSDYFLIHDMLSVCSHSNTTDATSRVEQHQSSPPVFCFTVVFYRPSLVLLSFFFWQLTFGFWLTLRHNHDGNSNTSR